MNMLVDYASDSSDSEVEVLIKAPLVNSTSVPPTQRSATSTSHSSSPPPSEPPTATTTTDDASDETFISAALKELQSFAASVDENTSIPDTEAKEPIPELQTVENESSSEEEEDEEAQVPAPAPSLLLTPEQQATFKAFMERIDAIPLTSADQSHPPAVPKRPLSVQDREQLELDWQRYQSVPSIYSRIHRLSTLESPTLNHEELEARLIEFAIRILDWEQGGLNAVYFLGPARAVYVAGRGGGDGDEGMDRGEDAQEGEGEFPPPYGGVVGETLQHLYELESTAAPPCWKLVWNAEEEMYSFHHIVTGTVSEEYPPQDELDRLDPRPPKSPVSFKKRASLSVSPEPTVSIPDAKKQKTQESDSE
ncbi:hypothetical protein BGZ74_001373 [Mortierella antarctica]|nr:hypothetical protein BGZ74_001373 [Mortierella antarctica]